MAFSGNAKGKMYLGIAAAIVLIALAGYIYYTADSHKARFVISTAEISTPDDVTEEITIRAGDKVYFWFGRKRELIDVTSVRVTIERADGKDGSKSFGVTYDIAKDFARLSAYLPGEYFSAPGRYNLTGYMDNDSIATCSVTVTPAASE